VECILIFARSYVCRVSFCFRCTKVMIVRTSVSTVLSLCMFLCVCVCARACVHASVLKEFFVLSLFEMDKG